FPIRPVGIHGQYSQQPPVLAAHEPANTGITWVSRHQLIPKVHASGEANSRAVRLQQKVVFREIERIFWHSESSRGFDAVPDHTRFLTSDIDARPSETNIFQGLCGFGDLDVKPRTLHFPYTAAALVRHTDYKSTNQDS